MHLWGQLVIWLQMFCVSAITRYTEIQEFENPEKLEIMKNSGPLLHKKFIQSTVYKKIRPTYTVNPLYNVDVGPQWFMTLKWICRCNDFLLFRPRDDKMQNKYAATSTWFAMSKSLISNLDKSAETCCRTIFPNQVFRLVHVPIS